MKIGVELHEPVAPGQHLTGRIVVLEGGPARSLSVGVGFYERSPGFRVPAVEHRRVVHQGELATGESVPFHYRLPESALPTVSGRHCELFWELEARVDRPGQDEVVRRRFEVRAARR